jgi:outer membrane protein OmpA-like peptidoglycan-associated protein
MMRPFCVLVVFLLAASRAPAQAPEIPVAPEVTFVLAVGNQTPAQGAPGGILQGDYEFVVRIVQAGAGGVTQTASFDGRDAAGVQRRGSVTRVVSAADLANARVQVLGFLFDDPPAFAGTTALGPSLAVTRELLRNGEAAYSFRNWGRRETISGTLRRTSPRTVRFPVLLNGRRVELEAVHVEGVLALGTARRPFEMILLDHPTHPISLRVAYGARDAALPVPARADFFREVVRIDFPTKQNTIAAALTNECRVELQGIYFDFNEATLKPESVRALTDIATALKSVAGRRLRLEGHTDNIGSDRYNDDLSARRAEAVKTALVRDHGADGARLSTVGRGERQPIETNDTLAGRARNRRVELVCAER